MDSWRPIAQLSKGEIFNLQKKKLQSFIQTRLFPFSPYYQNLFKEHKIDPRKIKSIEDLKHIPLTSKKDLLSTEENPVKYRDFILQPDPEKIRQYWPKARLLSLVLSKAFRGEEYVKESLAKEFRPIFMTYTTGTTNQPVPFLYSDYDLKNLYTSGARMLSLFKIDPAEKVISIFPFAPHLAFWQVVFGGLASGLFILSTGGGKVLGTEGNVLALERLKPSVLLGVPSYVYHVLRMAKEKGCRLDSIQKVVLGASRVTNVFKERLAELLGEMGAKDVSVFGTYGFTESRAAWAECPTPLGTSSGYHLYPDKEIIEIIDPETGEIQPEGKDGEIVYTPLDARASVVIRYRTGDFAQGGITGEPCPYCKRTVPRLSSDITRLSDVKDLNLSKIKGALVNLNHFAECLSNIEQIEEWQLEIRKKDNDPFEVDELAIYVCPKDGADRARVEREIKDKILTATELSPNEVVFLSYPEIVKRLELETSNKEKRVLDNRPK